VSAACLISTDLASVRLIAEGVDDVWTAPPAEDPDQPPALRTLAEAAAGWIAERLPGRRLDAACLDVDEARCLWIAAPTREAAVITAAVRQRRAEWGDDDGAGDLVQPLVEPRPAGRAGRGGGTPTEPFAAVLETPDAAVKLLFDALDARGVRVGEALSLWHALARRAGDGLECVIAADRPDRLLWAWGHEGGLVAAGMCRQPSADSPGNPAAGRLALDWLTWSAQLGRTPERFTLLGEVADVPDAIASAWPSSQIETVSTTDPLRELLGGAAAAVSPESDPRRSTPTLTRRSSRSHRRVYRLAALCVVLLAIGIAGLGVRAQQAAGAYHDARSQLRTDARELVRVASPGNENNPDLVSALDSHFATIKRDFPRLEPPPTPRPIFSELERLLVAIEKVDGAAINRISIEDRTGSAQLRIATYADGEKLMSLLDAPPEDGSEHPLDWSERVNGAPPTLIFRLTGPWK